MAGAAAAAAALGSGWLVATVLEVPTPVGAVGTAVIDSAPFGIREWAIRTLGTYDKPALTIGIVVILVLVAGWAQSSMASHPGMVAVAVAGLSSVGAWAAWASDGWAGVVPSVVAGLVGFASLWSLSRTELPPSPTPEMAAVALDRRVFLRRAATVGAVGVGTGGVALVVDQAKGSRFDTAIAEVSLPRPAGPPLLAPAGVDAGRGVEPWLTPADRFYRIDTALTVPRVDLAGWRLSVGGMVERPTEFTFDELLALGVVERHVTLCCVSNEVGGPYVGNARWLGVPLSRVLDLVGVDERADQLASESEDGWTCGFPTAIARDGRDALLAVGMNGEPLPADHGFPVRLVVPGLYGYVSATKWLRTITLTTFADFEGYWIPRGWAAEAPVKTQSRIDVPAAGAGVERGQIVIAGVAWAQHRGIEGVEVRIDDGPWQPANLATDGGVDAWRQWWFSWDAPEGSHELSVRATDGAGDVQTAQRTPPAPDGATGHHRVTVDVR